MFLAPSGDDASGGASSTLARMTIKQLLASYNSAGVIPRGSCARFSPDLVHLTAQVVARGEARVVGDHTYNEYVVDDATDVVVVRDYNNDLSNAALYSYVEIIATPRGYEDSVWVSALFSEPVADINAIANSVLSIIEASVSNSIGNGLA